MTVSRSFFLAAALALSAAVPAQATDVGVSVSVGQPGFYGRIDIGNYPQPRLIYMEPRIVSPQPQYNSRRPIYLHVPPGHAKDWAKHCAKYAACGQPVYFVEERWYQEVYAPQYRRQHPGAKREAYRGNDDRRGEERRREERRVDRREDGQRYEERRREERQMDRGDDRRGAQGRQDAGKGKGNGNGGDKRKGRED